MERGVWNEADPSIEAKSRKSKTVLDFRGGRERDE
jgi:hypothetical protein